MPFLIIGILLGMPLGVIVYFKVMAEADRQSGIEATYRNSAADERILRARDGR